MQTVTKENLLMSMLQCGWEWRQSKNPGLMDLCYGSFVWSIDPFRYHHGNLMDAITSNAFNLGRKYPNDSLDEALIKALEDYREARDKVSDDQNRSVPQDA